MRPSMEVERPTVTPSAADFGLGTPAAWAPIEHTSIGDADATPGPDEWLGFAVRVSSGRPSPNDLRRLAFAFTEWLTSDVEDRIEPLLGVPRTRSKRRQLLRDRWLLKAVPHLRSQGPWTAAMELSAQWRRFVTRGDWRRWRELREPPHHADELGRALFWATRYNGGDCLDERQIARVIRHVIRRT